MMQIFDQITRQALLEKGGDIVIEFTQKGCAGLTISISPCTPDISGEYSHIEEGKGKEGEIPLRVWVKSEYKKYLEGARITRSEKGGREKYIYSGQEVKNRCGCGSSFALEGIEVTTKKHISDEKKLSSLQERLKNVKNNLTKKTPHQQYAVKVQEISSQLLSSEEEVGYHNTLSDIILDHGSEADSILTIEHDRAKLHYTLILDNKSSTKRKIISRGSHQDLTIHLLVNASHTEEKRAKVSHEVIVEIHGVETKLESKSLTLSSQEGLTRVLSGIRVLSGHSQEAHLTQRSLLLSEKSSIAQIPLLDVHTDRSIASHSASIVSITPEEIFYLMSRGIDASSSRDMKITSLIREVASSDILSDEDLRSLIDGHSISSIPSVDQGVSDISPH